VQLPPSEPEPDSAGRTTFETRIRPLLDDRCAVCHADPAMAPAFLSRNPEVYDTVIAWPSLVRIDEPERSRLITKGEHDGPAWEQSQIDAILAWLEVEADPAEDVVVPDDEDDPVEDDGEVIPDDPLCRDLDAFASMARPPLDEQCGNCHGGGGAEAVLALDLTPPPEARAVVCDEVAGFVDRDRPMSSLLFTVVDPNEAPTHPFDFNGNWPDFGAFRTALLQWINDSD
jgi:mono/diheme cytochrome c family protein